MKLLFVMIFLFFFKCTSCEISCKDKDGKPVDWFIVYKLPRLDGPTKMIRAGLGHLYMDVNNPTWTLSDVSLNVTQHAIAYTVDQVHLNSKSENAAYVLYNDEHPEGYKDFNHGHTKGVVLFDNTGGFWLVHSLPKFPGPSTSSYYYPHNGLIYGQTFLCISLPYKYLDVIGELFLYNYPSIYDYNLPPSFQDNKHMAAAVGNKHVRQPPWNISLPLQSVNGQSFQAFAKFTKFDKDLYSDWLAPYYRTDMDAETWQHGSGVMPSRCDTKFKVCNVETLKFEFGSGIIEFHETKDHAKWGIGVDGAIVLCIGDINRDISQEKRAGGTVCFKMTPVYKSFKGAISSVEKCPSAK